MSGGEVRVRATVVHGGVHVPVVLPGDPGMELEAIGREDAWPCDHRHTGEADPRRARGALVHPAGVAPVARDQGQVNGCGWTSPLCTGSAWDGSFVELNRSLFE